MLRGFGMSINDILLSNGKQESLEVSKSSRFNLQCII